MSGEEELHPVSLRAVAGSVATPADNLSPANRWLSFLEFIVGGAIVIAHNVYHVVPNEVPILFVLGLLSFKLRNGSWSAMGLGLPRSWSRTVRFALLVAVTRILLGGLVVDPITSRIWPAAVAPSGSEQIAGHGWEALRWLALVWTFAAFGEEAGYRGYLLNRAADVGQRSKFAYVLALLLVSALFGFGHFYKGPAGMIDSGMAGPVLGAAYLLSGRNLWLCILAHGFIDTFGVVALFLGGQT
jgi:membrane protease YdiL (CAAX protease family)